MKNQFIFTLIFLIGFSCTTLSQVTTLSINLGEINAELESKMDSLFNEDQKYRLEVIKLIKGQAPKNKIDSMDLVIAQKDSQNLAFVEQMIAEHGWLGPSIIGIRGTQAQFLVIQHADLKTQKKYYPLILEAEKRGEILSSNVAILEDRIAVREGRRQTYGSQGYYNRTRDKTYIYPLLDVDNLDKLRKSRGLEPMVEYNKDWDVDDYKTYLPYAQELLDKMVKNSK